MSKSTEHTTNNHVNGVLLVNVRYYNCPPEDMTLVMAASHAMDHKAYGWGKQIDPRWNEEQREAYIGAYNSSNSLPR